MVELAGRKFLLQHIVNPHALADPLKARLARERPDVVVFGHTHKPFCETIGGTLFFNPGLRRQVAFRPGAQRRHPALHGAGYPTRILEAVITSPG